MKEIDVFDVRNARISGEEIGKDKGIRTAILWLVQNSVNYKPEFLAVHMMNDLFDGDLVLGGPNAEKLESLLWKEAPDDEEVAK